MCRYHSNTVHTTLLQDDETRGSGPSKRTWIGTGAPNAEWLDGGSDLLQDVSNFPPRVSVNIGRERRKTMATLRLPTIALVLLLAGSLCPASAGVRLGSVSLGAGYGYYGGPIWPGYYPPLLYDPWFDPFFGPAVYLLPQPDKGQVNLQSRYKGADVYLDSAYAGTTATLKKFWLAPGVYELEVRPKDQTPVKKRIYVLTGKTLKINME